MTLHTAKGLEFPVVFLAGLEDGILPHARSIESGDGEDMEEERRLCYVGITRAKRRLYLVHAFRRSVWGSSEVQAPSRFLDEIPADLLTGMVDKHSRRKQSYNRITDWDDSRPRERRASSTRGGWGRTKPAAGRSTYNWSGGDGSSSFDQSSKPIARPSQRKPARSTAKTEFKRRDSVQHPQFGVGTVIESNVIGGTEEVTVAFPGIGIKRLDAALAGLTKL